MKKYIIIIFAFFCSCSDTIDFVPTNSYNELAVWENEQSVKLYINSFYRIFDSYFLYGSRPIGNDNTMADGLTDLLKYTSNSPGDGTGNLIMTQDGYTSVAANHFNIWSNAYVWNRRMLEFLTDLEKYSSKFSKERKLEFEAEVRFFRGYIFFLVLRNQGPFIIRRSLEDEPSLGLNTEAECWDFIEADLDFAANNLPSMWNVNTDDGRVSKWAALGMKSRAMLYAKRWQKAAESADKIIKEGPFVLEANYANIFRNDKNNRSKENILLKRYNSTLGILHNIDDRIAPSGDIQGRGGTIVPTQEIVDAYFMSNGDAFDPTKSAFDSTMYINRESRFYASVLYNGAPWKGRRVETWIGANSALGNGRDRFVEYNSTPYPFSTVTGYYLRKFADETNFDFDLEYKKSDQDCIEIRLGEIYLNLAEAQIELNRAAEARNNILIIRNRSLQTDVNNLKGNLKDELVKERMLELAFEGHRFWDLRRWNLAEETLGNRKMSGAKITKNSNGTFTYQRVLVDINNRIYPRRFDRFPIPIGELNNNPKIEKQPEGW